MRSREDWERELRQRQRNIDPIQRIPNVAYFQGSLIKGSKRLTGFQRVGAVVLGGTGLVGGLLFCVSGLVGLNAINSVVEGTLFLFQLLFGAISVYFAFRMVLNALVNNPSGQPRPRYHRYDRR